LLVKIINKTLIIIAIVSLSINYVMAGPFGLSEGMPKSQFKGELTELGKLRFELLKVPKKHSAFKTYVVQFGPKSGLCGIKALSDHIDTSVYGIELKNAFNKIESKLINTYGKNEKVDRLLPGSIWDESKDWMSSLKRKERFLIATWTEVNGSNLRDNIQAIQLSANALSTRKGMLTLQYLFSNFNKCKTEIANLEDDAL